MTFDDSPGLDDRWEPLRRLPVTAIRAGRLSYPDDDRTETRLCGSKLEEAFCDPLRLAVTIAQGKLWSNKLLGTQLAALDRWAKRVSSK